MSKTTEFQNRNKRWRIEYVSLVNYWGNGSLNMKAKSTNYRPDSHMRGKSFYDRLRKKYHRLPGIMNISCRRWMTIWGIKWGKSKILISTPWRRPMKDIRNSKQPTNNVPKTNIKWKYSLSQLLKKTNNNNHWYNSSSRS